MADAGRSLLFLSHSASRNGASLLLLHTLQWLRAHTPHRLEVWCQGGGPLVADFRAVATTHVAPAAAWPRAGSPAWGDAARAALVSPVLRALLDERHPDLLYANTSAAWNQVVALARPGTPLLWHVHELPYALALTLPTPQARARLAQATRVVAVSDAVCEALVQDCAVPRARIDIVNGFVPPPTLDEPARGRRRAEVRASLGWPEDAFVVGACGGPGWRKGSDLFLLAARAALDAQPAHAGARPLRFLWVGGDADGPEARQFAHDLRALGLEASCRRVASTADVDAHYAAMDVFALTSREDPYPLVMLEAAGHALPTLCFDGAGGAVEFADLDTAGIVVPYADVGALARVVTALAADERRRRLLGEGALRAVTRRHRVETQAPLILRSIERCLAADAPAAARLAWR
jgi:glycosyltransferase involved in cell wall biosynthesis